MAPVPHFTRYLGWERCGDTATGVFRFERPRGYESRAGQWFRLTLVTRDGEVTHTFTDAAAPGEPTMDIASRLTGSAFKDALIALEPGTEVRFVGPGGRLAIAPEARRVAFLMGGVGITPARSLIRDRVRRKDASAQLVLFYGNNDESCILFGDEFRELERRLGWFTLVEVIASPSDAWTGQRGFITAEVVRRAMDPLDGWWFVVAGPPSMLEPMRRVLDELAVPDERRAFESFTGYE